MVALNEDSYELHGAGGARVRDAAVDHDGLTPQPSPNSDRIGKVRGLYGSKYRKGQVSFPYASRLGTAICRTQIEFSDEEVAQLTLAFNKRTSGDYQDVDSFCRSVSWEEIAKNGDSLSPGRYIGTEEVESESDEDFHSRMEALVVQLGDQLEESRRLEGKIRESLSKMGMGF